MTHFGAESVLEDPSLVGSALAAAYTAEIDAWLRSVIDEMGDVSNMALVAVGGYGGRELSPGSDLDLLLLHNRRDAGELANAIWYPIWDRGMKLGHAVRTMTEALDLAQSDLDTATALLSARWIGGSAEMVEELVIKARAQWSANADSMLLQISENARERHSAAGELAFLLEPDLKVSRGGLRDLQAIGWVELADPSVVEDLERAGLVVPHATLLSARVELHRVTKRTANLLLLETQDDVADALGYDDADALMADVATSARVVSRVHDAVMHRIDLRSTRRRWRRHSRNVGNGIEILDNTLLLADGALVNIDPVLPLRVALAASRNDAFIESRVLDRLESSSARMVEPWPDEARELFVDLLLEGRNAIAPLEALDHVDLITRLLPEWAPNRCRPQRNAYHRFTVDRHLLETAAEAAKLADQVGRPDLLVLGGLFHDIGKGYPGDHSSIGADLVRTIAQRMGYPPNDVETLAALVENHLLLPDVASRRDLHDPATIAFVADKVGSVTTLELLSALTEADSIATGPSAWSPWKAELVGELTDLVVRYLTGGDPGEFMAAFPRSEHIELLRKGKEVVELDSQWLLVVTPDRVGHFSRIAGVLALHDVEILGANLYARDGMALGEVRIGGGPGRNYGPAEVVADLKLALRMRLAITPRLMKRASRYRYQRATTAWPCNPEVTVNNDASATHTILEVRGPDSMGFLFRVTRVLADLDLSIEQARVQTLGDDVIDTFYVRGSDGAKVLDSHYLAEIEMAVLWAIGSDA